MDTGSIIVGGLNIAGTSRTPSQKIIDGILEPGFHYGKQGNVFTDGHGIDVSGPVEKIWTTADGGGYADYGGSSGAAPVVTGVAALMISQDSTLTPLWVRHILRQTAQDSKLIAGEDMPGLVNAYEAVKQVSPPLPSPSPSGGFSKLSISESAPANHPSSVGVWITRDGQRKAVNPSQLLGIGITGIDLSGIEIVVDNKVMPIQQVVSNYVSFGLTPTLAPGVKDMLITLAGNTPSPCPKPLKYWPCRLCKKHKPCPRSAHSNPLLFRSTGSISWRFPIILTANLTTSTPRFTNGTGLNSHWFKPFPPPGALIGKAFR